MSDHLVAAPSPVEAPPPRPDAQYAPAPGLNVFAIVGFVVSLIGPHIGGIVLGHIGLSQINRTGEGGRGFAVAALIIGYLAVAFQAIAFIILFALLVTAGFASSYSDYSAS